MDDFSSYFAMRDTGSTPGAIYLAAKAAGLDHTTSIRLLRQLFQLTLPEAKEVMVIADGLAGSLSEQQEKLVPMLERVFEEVEMAGSDDVGG